MLAPELRPRINEKMKIEEYAKQFGLPTEKINFIKLKIKMDLASRNQYAIIKKFSDVLNNLNEKNVENASKQMQSKHFCSRPKAESEELSYV